MTLEPASVICVTPVRNEAWVLDAFIRRVSLWADHIVIADQGSTDGSDEIARRHSKVTFVRNPAPTFDDGANRRLTLAAARRIPGKRVIVSVDADEAITANWRETAEWRRLLDAPTGTILRFEWVNLLPGFNSAWIPPEDIPFGFVDDGSEYRGFRIHPATRLPVSEASPVIHLRDVKLLHLQYAQWNRMKSKQRWYQCWERIHLPRKRPIQIYRQYHQMDAIPKEHIHPVDPCWLSGYERAGAPLAEVRHDTVFETDREVLELFRKHGRKPFRRLDVWDVDWPHLAWQLGWDGPVHLLTDPRSSPDKLVHRWLAHTQHRLHDPRIRLVQRLLIPLGW